MIRQDGCLISTGLDDATTAPLPKGPLVNNPYTLCVTWEVKKRNYCCCGVNSDTIPHCGKLPDINTGQWVPQQDTQNEKQTKIIGTLMGNHRLLRKIKAQQYGLVSRLVLFDMLEDKSFCLMQEIDCWFSPPSFDFPLKLLSPGPTTATVVCSWWNAASIALHVNALELWKHQLRYNGIALRTYYDDTAVYFPIKILHPTSGYQLCV